MGAIHCYAAAASVDGSWFCRSLQDLGRNQPAERAIANTQGPPHVNGREGALAHRDLTRAEQIGHEQREVRIVPKEHRCPRAGVGEDLIEALDGAAARQPLIQDDLQIEGRPDRLCRLQGTDLGTADEPVRSDPGTHQERAQAFCLAPAFGRQRPKLIGTVPDFWVAGVGMSHEVDGLESLVACGSG